MLLFLPPDYNFLENENSFDLDLFLFDSTKIIHIATAGMTLINSLRELTPSSYNKNFKTVLGYRRLFMIESNEKLERNNLTERENYFSFFNLMAKRGFYSYDKVDIDKKETYDFQLISKPNYNRKLIINNKHERGDTKNLKPLNYDLNFIEAKNEFPDDFDIFDLSEYI